MTTSWGRPEEGDPTPHFDLAAEVERTGLPDSWGEPRATRAAVNQMAEKQAKWDSRGLGLALEVSTWSSCPRAQVGAVVMSPEHDVISTGFNDTAAGMLNCGDGGCPRVARAEAGTVVPGVDYADEDECLHAEDNALQRAGLSARGATLYITRPPCATCQRRAKTAGIARTVVVDPAVLEAIREQQ